MIKNLIKKNEKLYFKIRLIRTITLPQYFVNFIFQKIFRRHRKINCSINFTSKIAEKNIVYNRDFTTLTSFAVSGGCYFQALNGIKLGKNFLFAPGVKLLSANHDFSDYTKSTKNNPIEIGDNVWLGANVVILPGVELGDNCVVGAGSVVTKSFKEPNLVIVGNPAKILYKKDNKDFTK